MLKLLRVMRRHLVFCRCIHGILFDFVLFVHPLPAPMLPPSNVKVTLIEEDTALVSWKPPEEPNLAVTRYTILYASRNTWIAGEWQVLQREGKMRIKIGHTGVQERGVHSQRLPPVPDK